MSRLGKRVVRSSIALLVSLVVLAGCANPLDRDGTDGQTPEATSAPAASPTQATLMPIVTPTPVVPGTLDPNTQPGAPTPVSVNPETYVVQEGDSLYAIALRFSVELQAIIELNGLSDPNDIRVGQELRIPPR